MDFMDIDFDGADRVKDFLLQKYSDIEKRCDALKRKCEERKRLCEEKLALHKFVNDDSIQVTLLRKRIFNKRFAFQFFVCNANESSLEKPNVILTSKRFHRLSYMFKIYEELEDPPPCNFSRNCLKFTDKLVLTDKITKQCHIVLVCEIQQFQGSLEEEMEGSLFVMQNGKKLQVTLPKIEISIDDCTNRFMSDWSSYPQDVQDVLTIIACNFSEKLLLILPGGWCDDLNRTFEIYCGFTTLNLDSSCKHYYFIEKFSEIFQGCLIEIHPADRENPQLLLVTVYQKDPDCAVFFSHLIQKSIPEAQVFHRSHLDKYLMSHKLDCLGEGKWELFRSHLLQEMDFVENSLKETAGMQDNVNYVKFMNKLALLEKKTDEIFSAIYNR